MESSDASPLTGNQRIHFCVQKVPNGSTQQATASKAVAAVRKLKADRDTLRDHLHELKPSLVSSQQHDQAVALVESLADAISTMESLVGGPNPVGSGGEKTLTVVQLLPQTQNRQQGNNCQEEEEEYPIPTHMEYPELGSCTAP